MKVKVINSQGQDTGRTVELKDSIFNIEPNEHAIYLDVKQHMANKRQGTSKAKERGEIKGSTKKLRRQKGSGAARVGSIKNPLFRGGGRVFGPRPRDYDMKVNKKVKQLARRSALTLKLKDNEIIVFEEFSFDNPRTKDMIKIQENLQIKNKKSLFVFNNKNNYVYLSSRNLQDTSIITVSELNTYKVLDNKILFISEAAVEFLNNIL